MSGNGRFPNFFGEACPRIALATTRRTRKKAFCIHPFYGKRKFWSQLSHNWCFYPENAEENRKQKLRFTAPHAHWRDFTTPEYIALNARIQMRFVDFGKEKATTDAGLRKKIGAGYEENLGGMAGLLTPFGPPLSWFLQLPDPGLDKSFWQFSTHFFGVSFSIIGCGSLWSAWKIFTNPVQQRGGLFAKRSSVAFCVRNSRYSRIPLFRSPTGHENNFEIVGYRNIKKLSSTFILTNH